MGRWNRSWKRSWSCSVRCGSRIVLGFVSELKRLHDTRSLMFYAP
ncbi:hypothetical protein M3J09_007962 [Ascochyta lentis]